MPVDVLHILGTARAEGAAIVRIVSMLAKGVDRERYRIHAWFLGAQGPLAAELQSIGVQVRQTPWERGARDPGGAWRFWRDLLDSNFAIIHQHFGARSVRWLARRASRARLIVHLHGRILESEGPYPVPLEVRGADAVIAVCTAVAKQVIGATAQVVYSGTTIPCVAAQGSATGRVLGVACRLIPVKGLPCLIRAMAVLRAEFPDLRLEIAGSGPERQAIQQQAESLGLGDSVCFLGWRTDLGAVWARWDIFVQPSLDEGLPIAVLEAMAAGLPVVATGVGGTPEVVEDGRTGWLVPAGDTGALAARLRALLLDSRKRREMGAAGRARVRENFSADRMAQTISMIYDEVLKSRDNIGRVGP